VVLPLPDQPANPKTRIGRAILWRSHNP